ncbi:MAG: hypothetical protein K2I06_11295 [Ruminococcus sp.]|nr:hypothetical protein [Ruminococcus sp.]
MFKNPIIVYTTPFYSDNEEQMILNPDKIIGFGVDKHMNMFVSAVDGGRYYIAENCEQTALDLCLYMYNDSKDFDDEKIKDMFSCTHN